jgi:CRP/FNR family cyclic AMP-dependent transcriptional regulator
MRKVLYILSEFEDRDIDWIVGSGARESVAADQVLVKQGDTITSLYVVLDGHFKVSVEGGAELARLGTGEIVGELSFFDSRPPNANVTATEDSQVLAIPSSRLRSKLKSDNGFGSRFYRALGVMLTDRLRDTVGMLAYGSEHLSEDVDELGELSPDLLENMGLAAARFDDLLRRLREG